MYTSINVREKVTILCDKMPRGGRLKTTHENTPNIPIAYKRLHDAIMTIVDSGDNGKIHLFDILASKDERIKLQGANIHTNRRELEKLQAMIISWVGDSYQLTITYGAELDGYIFIPIEGPIITIEKPKPPKSNDFKKRVLSYVEGVFRKS